MKEYFSFTKNNKIIHVNLIIFVKILHFAQFKHLNSLKKKGNFQSECYNMYKKKFVYKLQVL